MLGPQDLRGVAPSHKVSPLLLKFVLLIGALASIAPSANRRSRLVRAGTDASLTVSRRPFVAETVGVNATNNRSVSYAHGKDRQYSHDDEYTHDKYYYYYDDDDTITTLAPFSPTAGLLRAMVCCGATVTAILLSLVVFHAAMATWPPNPSTMPASWSRLLGSGSSLSRAPKAAAPPASLWTRAMSSGAFAPPGELWTQLVADGGAAAPRGKSLEPEPDAGGTPPPAASLGARFGDAFGTLVERMYPMRRTARDLVQREGSDRLAVLDGVRALAFIWVTAHHFHTYLDNYASNGSGVSTAWDDASLESHDGDDIPFSLNTLTDALLVYGELGVTSFFVLSGFLIPYILARMVAAAPVAKPRPRLVLEFLYRRFLRIWPALNTYVPLSMAFTAATGYLFSETYSGACYRGAWWTNLVFLTNVEACLGVGSTCEDHLWTVSTEWQMYLVTPLFVFAFLRDHRLGFALVGACFAVCLAAAWKVTALNSRGVFVCKDTPSSLDSFLAFMRLPEYCAGMACAFSYLGSVEASDSKPTGKWGVLDGARAWSWRRGAIAFVSLCQLAGVGAALAYIGVFSFPVVKDGDAGWSTVAVDFFTVGEGTYTAFAVVLALLIRSALDPDLGGLARAVLSHRVWYPFAALSYTGYLWGYVASAIVCGFLREAGFAGTWSYLTWTLYVACSMAVLMLLAFANSLLIERPFMNLRS